MEDGLKLFARFECAECCILEEALFRVTSIRGYTIQSNLYL